MGYLKTGDGEGDSSEPHLDPPLGNPINGYSGKRYFLRLLRKKEIHYLGNMYFVFYLKAIKCG